MWVCFLLNRKHPCLPLTAGNKAITILMKLCRRTPLFRPGSYSICRNNPSKTVMERKKAVKNKYRRKETRRIFQKVEVLDVGEIFKQGNFEMALMAGDQEYVDIDEDNYPDEFEDCSGYMKAVLYKDCEEEEEDPWRGTLIGPISQQMNSQRQSHELWDKVAL